MDNKLLLLIIDSVPWRNWRSLYRALFNSITDVEYDEPTSSSIIHNRFHSMTGFGLINLMKPGDADMFATVSTLIERHAIEHGYQHECVRKIYGHAHTHVT